MKFRLEILIGFCIFFIPPLFLFLRSLPGKKYHGLLSTAPGKEMKLSSFHTTAIERVSGAQLTVSETLHFRSKGGL